MLRIPPLLIDCAITGGIAIGAAVTWMTATGQHTLSVAAIVACTLISVVLALAADHIARRIRRSQPRRAHARPDTKTRKAA